MTRAAPKPPDDRRPLKVVLPPGLYARLHEVADAYVVGVNLLACKAIESYLDELDRMPRDPLLPPR